MSLIVVVLCLGLSGCSSSKPVTPSAESSVESSTSTKFVDSRIGLRVALPAGWALRADAPLVLAVWPDPFVPGSGENAQSLPDGVIIITHDYYLMTSDEFTGPNAFESARQRLEAKGYALEAPFAADLHGAPAKAVRGVSTTGTALVVVSPSYVLVATTVHDAPPSGLTTQNVAAVLESVGYTQSATP